MLYGASASLAMQTTVIAKAHQEWKYRKKFFGGEATFLSHTVYDFTFVCIACYGPAAFLQYTGLAGIAQFALDEIMNWLLGVI